jgi:hypothetical protein
MPPGQGFLFSCHCSKWGRALRGPRAKPSETDAPLAPGNPTSGFATRTQGGVWGVETRGSLARPGRPTWRSESLRLSDLNRGGRAARPGLPATIGCGGGVTWARSWAGEGGEEPGRGVSERLPAPEPESESETDAGAAMGRPSRRGAEPTEGSAQPRLPRARGSGGRGRRPALASGREAA